MTDITDQLAQALEAGHPSKVWDMARMNYTTGNSAMIAEWHEERCKQVDKAIAAYRASKEGEKVEYRTLEPNEIIKKGDECRSGVGPWVKARLSIGERYGRQHTEHRRPIRATWADETAQRLADNYKAASESGNLPEVP